MEESQSGDTKPEPIRIYVRRELYLLPTASTTAGLALGLLRGSRKESLRFLAENAHRTPTTIRGWYLYNKTKNYRVFLAGLKQGGRDALRFGSGGLIWVGFEEGARRGGIAEWREICAGVGTAGIASAIYRLPRQIAGRVMTLGVLGGGLMTGLRKAQEYVGSQVDNNDQ